MAEGLRSPFGKLLRAYRQQRGLSQAGLADLIAERNFQDPEFAKLGVVTEKAIANLETASRPPARWVRPRPQTVSLFLAALEIAPGSREEEAFLSAAEETRNRTVQRAQTIRQPNLFIPEGREVPLEILMDAWDSARSGTPQFVLISGDAGTGKTRLIQHLWEVVNEQSPTTIFVSGRCTPGAEAIEPYQPFLNAFNQLLGISTSELTSGAREQDPDEKILVQMLTLAPGLVGPMVNEAALFERIQQMGDQGQTLSEMVSRFRALNSPVDQMTRLDQAARFVTRVAEMQPLIIVLEDLHWANERACTLLLHLQRHVQYLSHLPLMVIGSYRSSDLLPSNDGERHPMHRTIAELQRHAEFPIIDLSTSVGGNEGRRFINGLLRNMGIDDLAAEGLGEFLFERTQGHALFAVELFRWLRDRRQLQREPNGTWRPGDSAIMSSVPHKVRAMVAERIQRLPVDLRRVLSIAATQGQIFLIEVLARAANLNEDELSTIIDDELTAYHKLLAPTESTTVAGVTLHRYAFAHQMFQEYLYSSMSDAERVRTHGLIAQALVDVMGMDNNAVSGEIAIHFQKARKFQEAGFYAYMAGAHATHLLEFDLALAWFERAIEFATEARDLARVGRAQNGIALIKRRLGLFDEGIDIARKVLEHAQRHGFQNLEGECYTQLGQFYYDLMELDAAERNFQKAREIYNSLGNRFDLSGVESMLSHVYYRRGRYDDALAHARVAGRLSAELDHHDHTAEAMLAAGNCEIDLGMYDKALDTYQQAVTFYRAAGDHRGELLCSLNSGLANVNLGEYDEAVIILNNTMDLVIRRRLDRYLPFVASYLAMAHEGRGEYDRAADLYRTARDRRRDSGLGGFAQDNVAGLLRIATARNDRASMMRYTRELADWFAKQGDAGLEDPLGAYLALAIAQEALGDVEKSRETTRVGYQLLMSRARMLTEPETVRSYLENVPTNRKLRARYAAMSAANPVPIAHTPDSAPSSIAAP